MANIIPLKCADNQHKPMVPGEDKIDSSLLPNLIAGEGIQITKDANGDFVITNLCCDDDTGPVDPVDSTHTIASITPASNPVIEGQTACFNVVLNGPVTGSSLQLDFSLGGSDQIRNNYAAPSLVIPVGQSSGQVCVNTTDDLVVDGTEVLSIQNFTSPRLTNQASANVDVADNDSAGGGDSVHTVASAAPVANPITEGQQACWVIQLNAAVTGSPLVVNTTLSGGDHDAHGYAAPSVTIPVGQSSGQVCVTTTDDAAVDGPQDLCLTVNTGSRISAVPAPSCITVNDNDAAVPQLTDITSDQSSPVPEGQDICYTVYSNLPAPAGGFPFTVTVSGTDGPGGNVCGSYDGSTNGPVITTLSGSIPQGQTQATVCYVRDVAGPADSSHEVTVNVATNTVEEGQQICWNFVTTGVVAGSPLTIPFTFSGTEQSVHNYPAANVVVPVGQTQAQYCLTITDDAIVEGPLELCLDVTVGGRVTSTQSADNCATVNDNDSSAPSIAFSGMGYNWGDCIGGSGVTQATMQLFIQADGTYTLETDTNIASPTVQSSGTWATGTFNPADYSVSFSTAGVTGGTNQGAVAGYIGGNLASGQVMRWLDDNDPVAKDIIGNIVITRNSDGATMASLPVHTRLSANVECP